MQKSLIVLALLAAGTAYAQVSTVANGSVVAYTGSTGIGAHSASGSAYNLTIAGAASGGNLTSANAATNAASTGSTTSNASGLGNGVGFVQAAQGGEAVANRTGVQGVSILWFPIIPTGSANAMSNAAVGTLSNAHVVNSGLAGSGTNAHADNQSSAGMTTIPGIPLLPTSSSSATGATNGHSNLLTGALATWGDSANAYGTMSVGPVNNVGAFNTGSFQVTRP